MEIAIVTGASSGLGREYAKLLDQEGLDEIWLVARRRPQLETLAGELTTKSRIYALDLTDRASLLTLQQALAACQVTVRYLIHAAGFGKMGPVAAVPAGVLENMIDLNDRAAVSLVQAVLPYCHAGSHLVQICSCAAFLPIPEPGCLRGDESLSPTLQPGTGRGTGTAGYPRICRLSVLGERYGIHRDGQPDR